MHLYDNLIIVCKLISCDPHYYEAEQKGNKMQPQGGIFSQNTPHSRWNKRKSMPEWTNTDNTSIFHVHKLPGSLHVQQNASAGSSA